MTYTLSYTFFTMGIGEVTDIEDRIYDFMEVAKQFKLADFAKECSDKDDDDVRNNLEELSRCEQIIPDKLINNSILLVDNLNFDKKPCMSYSKDKEEITKNSKELYRNHEEKDDFSSTFINGNWQISTSLVENTSINVETSVLAISKMCETKNEYREFREIQDEGIDLSKSVFDDKPITSGLFHANISSIGTKISKGGENLEPQNLCPECGNTYRTKSILAIHRRKQHQGIFYF